MRYMVMSFTILVMLFSQDLLASAKTDSIVTFLGGSQAKLVWMKWAWCNENYAPKTQAAAKAEGWSMELLDTREGTQRTLTTGLVDANFMRISHTGKWATFIMGTSTYIIDLTAASPTRKVLMSQSDCTYWCVEGWWVDPANGTEYVYCLDNAILTPIDQVVGGGNGIYKVKVNSDGTVDRSTAIRPTTGGVYEYGHFHESHRVICVHKADGTYKEALQMGCTASDGEAHGLYWTNHVDYVTARLEEASPNPVLFDVVREKCVALKDDCNGDCGDNGPNAVLLPKSGTESRKVSVMPRASHVPSAPQKLYSIDGRLLSKSQIGASTSVVRSLRIPVGNQAAGIIVGCR